MKKVRLISIILWVFVLSLTANASQMAQPKFVALTFDDGPNGKITQRLLSELNARYISATFFLCGIQIEQYPELVKEIAESGHEIGNHGYHHKYLQNSSQAEILEEIGATSDLIESLTHTAPQLFRPPGGLMGDEMIQYLKNENLPIILWSIDPCDWNRTDTEAVAQHVISKVEDGSIILMHDLSETSVDAAILIMDELLEQGYRFCTVSELSKICLQPMTSGITYGNFHRKLPCTLPFS